jgi:hypothetical protein
MSIYILCGLHCDPPRFEFLAAALSDTMAGLGMKIELGGFEDEEKTELLADGYSWPPGVEFQLSDPADRVVLTR